MYTLHWLKVRYAVLILIVCLPFSAYPWGDTTMVSMSSGGVPGNSFSGGGFLSADGRYVAFNSSASNLVAGDTNNFDDIFVHDRVSGNTERVSVSSSGVQGNSAAGSFCLSADGRFVAFDSSSSNLVAGDTNIFNDIFVHDRVSGKTELMSVSSSGIQGNSASTFPSLSADGRYVAFDSAATNLDSGDKNPFFTDIFVHDRVSGKTEQVSMNSIGVKGNDYSFYANISANGRFVAFLSLATNLVEGDTNFEQDIFLHDRVSGRTERVSVSSSGVQGNFGSDRPRLSDNGRYVAFSSFANNLVADDTNDKIDIFVHDRVSGKTERVSVSSSGVQGNLDSSYPSLSADGRYVAFESDATNLVADDTNGWRDVFLHDRASGKTERVSVNAIGAQINSTSSSPSLSADGRYVTFSSPANNLVAGDTNERNDVFLRDRKLDKTHQGDLQIELTTTPASLAKGGQGEYTYTITNHGPDTLYKVNLTHVIANGKVLSFTPSQGTCKRMPALSMCRLKRLDSGQSLTLTANVQALRDSVDQSVSVTSAARLDPVPDNNYLTVSTPVTTP